MDLQHIQQQKKEAADTYNQLKVKQAINNSEIEEKKTHGEEIKMSLERAKTIYELMSHYEEKINKESEENSEENTDSA